jgi:HK97 family phage prohead protease
MRQFKHFKLKLSDAGGVQLAAGEFIGYASVFQNVDLGGDRVKRGAFARTIKAQDGRVPILWQHDTEKPIGVSLSLEEDSEGLKVHGQLNLEVQQGRECYALMKQGALKGLSIGYDVIRSSPGKNGSYRELEELKLYEFSPVTFPMNTEAAVERVKALRESGLSGNKYVDFATCDGESELYQARYRMADSLQAALYSIMSEGDRSEDERTALVAESLEQYKDAMVVWCSRYMEARATAKAGDGPDEAKAGRVLSAANRAKVQAAITALQELMAAADSGKAHSAAPEEPAPATEEAPRESITDDSHAFLELMENMRKEAQTVLR